MTSAAVAALVAVLSPASGGSTASFVSVVAPATAEFSVAAVAISGSASGASSAAVEGGAGSEGSTAASPMSEATMAAVTAGDCSGIVLLGGRSTVVVDTVEAEVSPSTARLGRLRGGAPFSAPDPRTAAHHPRHTTLAKITGLWTSTIT